MSLQIKAFCCCMRLTETRLDAPNALEEPHERGSRSVSVRLRSTTTTPSNRNGSAP